MSGPGVYTTHPICPDCHQQVEVQVLVTSEGRTQTISGISEHARTCDRIGRIEP